MMKPLLLASASPRRRQILALLDLPYTITVSPIDEDAISATYNGSGDGLARWLAVEKARGILPHAADQIVITADTTVLLDGTILGKPRDAIHARELLLALRDRWHSVVTGVAVSAIVNGEPLIRRASCATPVLMRPYSEEEIAAYIASGDPMDKAGAYGIQHPVFQPTAQIQGCYLNVVGLPLCTLVSLLAAFGILPGRDQSAPTHHTGILPGRDQSAPTHHTGILPGRDQSAPTHHTGILPGRDQSAPTHRTVTQAGAINLAHTGACPWSARCLIPHEVNHDQ